MFSNKKHSIVYGTCLESEFNANMTIFDFENKEDLSVFGKIIGGGMPIGAYGGEKALMEEMAPVGSIYQAGTLSGNPVAVSAGIATLELLNDEVYEKLESMGSYFENELNKVFDKYDHEIYFERIGSMFSLFFHSGPIRSVEDVEKCNFKLFSKYFHCLLRAFLIAL